MLGPGSCMLGNGEPTEGAGQAVTAAGTVWASCTARDEGPHGIQGSHVQRVGLDLSLRA